MQSGFRYTDYIKICIRAYEQRSELVNVLLERRNVQMKNRRKKLLENLADKKSLVV